MGRLVEELFDMLNDIEDDVQAVASPSYKKAIKDNQELKKELPKRFKDFKKSADDFVKNNHNKDFKPNGTKGMKKMKLSESLFEETTTVENDIYYKATRPPLMDIIQDEITFGEEVYRKKGDDKWIPTTAPSLNIPYEHVGGDEDTITVWAKDEDEVAGIDAIARKYGRETSVKYDRWVSGDRKYLVTIHMNPEDWDEPYFDPNVQVRPDTRRKR